LTLGCWFEDVVGELQPILHRVASVIQDAAMLRGDIRARRLEEALAQIRRDIDEKQIEGLDPDAYLELEPTAVEATPPPVTLKQMETALLRSTALGRYFKPHPDLLNTHILTWNGEHTAVTFDAQVFDQHPDSVQLLSYGNPLLEQLLGAVPDPPACDDPCGVGLYRAGAPVPMSLFMRPADGKATEVSTLAGLVEASSPDTAWNEDTETAAERLFTDVRKQAIEHVGRVAEQQITGERLALKEEARQILVRTALLGAVESQKPTLFAEPLPYSFGPEPVEALRKKGAPYQGLWALLSGEELAADPTDPFFLSVESLPSRSLRRKQDQLRQQGMEVLRQYRLLSERSVAQEVDAAEDASVGVEKRWFFTGASVES